MGNCAKRVNGKDNIEEFGTSNDVKSMQDRIV